MKPLSEFSARDFAEHPTSEIGYKPQRRSRILFGKIIARLIHTNNPIY